MKSYIGYIALLFTITCTGCKPQILKDASICYSLINTHALTTHDTLTIYNCCKGDYTWLAVVKDTNEFNTQFTVHRADADHYWRIPLKDTGRLHCRICVAYEKAYGVLKTQDFEIYVKPPAN